MGRVIKYSALVYAAVNNILGPATSHPFSKEIPSLFWAKRCLLISPTTLSAIQPVEQLDPLATIGLFLCSQKLSITHLVGGGQDITMKLLYKIAVKSVQQLLGEEEETAKGIKAICDNIYVQLEKIKGCIQNGDTESLDKAHLYVENTSIYLNSQLEGI